MTRTWMMIAAAALAASAGRAQAPESPVGYNGTIVSTAPESIVLMQKDGTPVTVAMSKGWTISRTRAATVADIKPGDFIASIQANVDANTGRANELRIFEPGYQPEIGTHAMPQPDTSITHGTVSAVVPMADGGRMLTIAYPGGTRAIIAPASIKVTAYDLLPIAMAKPGTAVGAITRKGSDGVRRGGRLTLQ